MQIVDPDRDWAEFDAKSIIEERLDEAKGIFAAARLELIPHILLVMDDRMPRTMAFTGQRAEMRALALQLADLFEEIPELVLELGEDMDEIIECAEESAKEESENG